MSTLIQSLHEIVTPKVLHIATAQAGSDENKTNALELLYRLFATRLANEEVVSNLAKLSNDELQDGEKLLSLAMTGKKTGETDFLVRLYDNVGEKFALPSASVSALATAALPLVWSHIKSLAGSKPIAAYVGEEKEGLIAGLPNWLTALLPAGLLGVVAAAGDGVSAAVHNVSSLAGEAVHSAAEGVDKAVGAVKEGVAAEGGFLKSLLPIIGAIILAGLAWLMLKGCQKDPAPVAAPVAPQATDTAAALAPATLSLGLNETGDGVFNCRGVVGNAGLGEQIKAAIASVFTGNQCNFDINTATASELPAMQALPQILGFMKGVPDATIFINDKTVRFNASNAEALQKLINDVKTAFPDLVVEAEPALNVEEAVKNSIEAAKSALEGLTDTSTVDDLIRALNLQIINFATDSSDIPADNQAVLDKAAERLKALPDAKLLITGHTDSQGQYEYNQALSERRAKAVHDYLVSKGVNDDKLEIKGASSSNPVATNATEQGRFANRRIEFTVFQDGEVVAEVGNTAATATEVPAEQPKSETTETK